MRNTSKYVMLVVVGLVLGLGVSELLLRFLLMGGRIKLWAEQIESPRYIINGRETPFILQYTSDTRYPYKLRADYQEHHHDRQYEYTFDFKTNGDGFRQDREIAAVRGDPSIRFRIMALGDSLTFGHGVNQQDSYPAQLNALQQDGMYAFNFGVGTWGFAEHSLTYQLYRDAVAPDLVTIGVFPANDFFDLKNGSWEGKAAQQPPARISRWDYWLDEEEHLRWSYAYKYPILRNSVLWIVVSQRALLLYERANPEPMERLAAALMGGIARDQNTLAIILPSKPSCDGLVEDSKVHLLELLEDTPNLYVLDLYPRFVADERCKAYYLTTDKSHMTPEGNRIVARETLDYIRAHGLLPASPLKTQL